MPRIVVLVLAFLLVACDAGQVANQVSTLGSELRATAGTIATTALPISTTSPTTQAPTTSVAPTAAPQATKVAFASGQRFQVSGRATSNDNVLSKVMLELRGARVDSGNLVLRVAFVNTTDQSFSLIGAGSGADGRLVVSGGEPLAPTAVDPALNTLDPKGGFSPGVANVGDLTFPLPNGSGPFELQFPRYTPIRFSLDTPLNAEASAPANGVYPLNAAVRSQRDALRPIELRFTSMELRDDGVVFQIAFANTGRQGYNLTLGPTGNDARLIDGEGMERAPSAVAPNFATSIAPTNGWQPGQENVGTITFPRPNDFSTLRFTFPQYDALTIVPGAGNTAQVKVTSPSGGAPAPTATPSAEELASSGIEAVLAQQATALLKGDADAYVANVAPALQAEQHTIAQRVKQMPIESLTLRLSPNANLGGSDTLSNVPIELTYTLRGIADNPFSHQLTYDFARTGDSWQITAVRASENPPFWFTSDVVMHEAPHFLMFVRPEAQGDIPALEQEAEQAYSTLQSKALPLEPRYVAYYTATQADFRTLTGRDDRYVGVALSRYEFSGDTITTTSRAFYINGATFRDNADLPANERLTTFTHELVHLALAVQTRPFSPPWLVEGVAVYLSEDTGAAQRQQLTSGGRLDQLSLVTLTRAGALGDHAVTQAQISDAYLFSGQTVAYLVEKYGEPKVLEFYKSYAAIPASQVTAQLPQFGGSGATDVAFADLSAKLTAQAVPTFFGVSLEQLDSDVKAWIRR